MPYKETEIVKKYYTIGEVAMQMGIATSLIRFWESEFDIIKPKKNRKGNRQFTVDDIENIKLIYHLVREKGFTLQGAKEMIKKGPNEMKDKLQMIDSLKEIRAFLLEIKTQLP
jgi:DNA-binding transcriptional MerR regulator